MFRRLLSTTASSQPPKSNGGAFKWAIGFAAAGAAGYTWTKFQTPSKPPRKAYIAVFKQAQV
jgi:hypothetical protein